MAGSSRMCVILLAAAMYGVDHAAGFISPFGGASHHLRRPDSCLCVLGPALSLFGRRSISLGCNAEGSVASEVASMRVGTIQGELRELGISYAGVFEKADLVTLLVAARANPPSRSAAPRPPPSTSSSSSSSSSRSSAPPTDLGGRKVALRKTMAQQGTLGAGVQVADHTYFAVRVRFPDQGGLETELVVDTAAGSSFITPAFAARVAAKPTGVTASVSTGTGGGGGLSQVTLGRMQFLAKDGGLVDAGRLDAIPIDLPTDPSISGLLGLDVLARFDVGISRGSLEASLHPPGSLQPPQDDSSKSLCASRRARLGTHNCYEHFLGHTLSPHGMREMPMSYLKPPAGLYSIQVRVAPVGGGGKESGTVTAIVDLGSPITIVNWRAMESAGIFPSSPLLRDTGEVVAGASVQGMGASSMRVFQATVWSIFCSNYYFPPVGPPAVGRRGFKSGIDLGLRAGGAKGEGVVKLGNHGVEVGDLPIFASLGMAGRPAMVLGSDVLLGGAGGGQMAISVSRSKLWVRLPDGV